MATSRDYAELYWAWDAWRAEVGAPARVDYARYVELKNMAAQANGIVNSLLINIDLEKRFIITK